MAAPHSVLDTWAERNPRVRWPLVFAVLLGLCLYAGWLSPTDF